MNAVLAPVRPPDPHRAPAVSVPDSLVGVSLLDRLSLRLGLWLLLRSERRIRRVRSYEHYRQLVAAENRRESRLLLAVSAHHARGFGA
jgi:hypothetical protein